MRQRNARVFCEPYAIFSLSVIYALERGKIMRVCITRPRRLWSNFRKVKPRSERAIKGASFRSCGASSSSSSSSSQGSHRDLPQQRFDFRAAARRETRVQANAEPAWSPDFSRFSARRESAHRGPGGWNAGAASPGESRRVARGVYGMVWHGMDIYAYSRGYDLSDVHTGRCQPGDQYPFLPM